jgi:peptidoglycan hydrolase-like protein with peptidoglycan-binding domain
MKTGIIKSFGIIGFLGIFTSLVTSVSAGYFNPTPLDACNLSIVSTLSHGSQNDDVLTLQNFLYRAGYLSAYPNGYYGYGTQAAVRSFQGDNGIRMTGTVGALTRDALNERLCDSDVSRFGNEEGSFSSGNTTYVSNYDPYVVVINAPKQNPALYSSPQADMRGPAPIPAISIPTLPVSAASNVIVGSGASQGATYTSSIATPVYGANGFAPAPIAPIISEAGNTSIVFNPSVGYQTVINQKSGSLTFTSPYPHAIYNEGETVNLTWTTNNIKASQYTVSITNKNNRQPRTVAVTNTNSASFVLTKSLLDDLCGGICLPNDTDTFSITITSPVVDIAGNVSEFKATISPITIKRVFAVSGMSLFVSKTPVDNNEVFKLQIQIPQTVTTSYGNYIYRVKAICPSNVTVSLAGTSCGVEYVLPFGQTSYSNELPVIARNTQWYKQEVKFEITASLPTGQVVGSAQTTVQINGAPFSW